MELSIIIGSRTAAAVADEFALLEIDSIRVKGKTEPEVIYTIHGRADLKETPAFKALQQAWESLRVCYRKQDWAGGHNRPLLIHACRRLSLARSPPLAGAHTRGRRQSVWSVLIHTSLGGPGAAGSLGSAVRRAGARSP
jgi:hypothetical protein